MEKQKLEILVTTLLVALFLVLLTGTLSRRNKKVQKESPLEEPKTETAEHEVYKLPAPRKLTWGRDPFVLRPKKFKEKEDRGFLLTAIIWDEEEPHAIINNEVVVVGQVIEGYRVIKITKDSAVLKKGDSELAIELYK